MLDAKGVLNPGMMPQTLDDLARSPRPSTRGRPPVVALESRHDVWREDADFRQAVLRYATRSAYRDTASADLWPEVVYPLIERARWQRTFRPTHEAVWDFLCRHVLRVPAPGVRLDRMMVMAVPHRSPSSSTRIARRVRRRSPARRRRCPPAAEPAGGAPPGASRSRQVSLARPGRRPRPCDKALISPANPDPFRFTQGDLRDLWSEAVAASEAAPGATGGHRNVPVGPYRLAVIPSIRGRSAGQVALQGMPTSRSRCSFRRSAWPAARQAGDRHLDLPGRQRRASSTSTSRAPNATSSGTPRTPSKFNFEDPADLNHMLYTARPGGSRPARPGAHQEVPAEEPGVGRMTDDREIKISLVPTVPLCITHK